MKLKELMSTPIQEGRGSLTRAEKDAKRAEKRAEADAVLANLHAQQQAEKKAAFDAKYNDGRPIKIMLDVDVGGKMEKREFTIDNYIEVRHKLDGIVLQDMSKLAGHKGEKPTYAIRTDGVVFYTGSLPEYLFDLPKRTQQKSQFVGKNDLRRETFDA